jgi:hypothetical protein
MEVDNLRLEFKKVLIRIETLFESMLSERRIHSATRLLRALGFLALGDVSEEETTNDENTRQLDPVLVTLFKDVDQETLDLLDNQGRVVWKVERTGACWMFGKEKGNRFIDQLTSFKGVGTLVFVSGSLNLLGFFGLLEVFIPQELAFTCWCLVGIFVVPLYSSCISDFRIVRQLIFQPIFFIRMAFILGWSISLVIVTNAQLASVGVAISSPLPVACGSVIDAATYKFRKFALWCFVLLTLASATV